MKIEGIYHTGFVVRDLEKALEFYLDILGLQIEREPVSVDSDWLAQVVGYPEVQMKMAYVGVGDGHSIELIEYITPFAERSITLEDRNRPGSAHAAFLVDDVEDWRKKLISEGIHVQGPPDERDLEFPWARRAIYLQDLDGNWLEMVQRHPRPKGRRDN